MLSLVIPAYNEELRLPATLTRVREYLDSTGEPYEVIVVDDGSSDHTVATTRDAAASWPQLCVIALPRNRGKGAAVRAGMLAAIGEVRAFSDADLSTPIEELPRLREQLGPGCEVVIGSRATPGAVIETHQPKRREAMGRAYNRLLQLLALPGLYDTQCGFKVFSAEAAVRCFEPLRTFRYGFDAEVLLRARRLGYGVGEVPVRWAHREDSRVSPLRDSARTLYELVTLRFTVRR